MAELNTLSDNEPIMTLDVTDARPLLSINEPIKPSEKVSFVA